MKSFFLVLLFVVSTNCLAEPVNYADSTTIDSSVFGEPREIMVSLPKSYRKNPTDIYPVIYVVRGQLDMLGVLAAINMLDAESPEFIVIGITGSGSEFIPSIESEPSQFSKLLNDEVVPYIQRHYRTAPFSILVGHSAAGKFVTNEWLGTNSHFSSYYAISPELHDGAINARANLIN